MPDVPLWATVVSTSGAVLAAIGAVAVTNWGAVKRDVAQAERLRREQRVDALRQACADLLAAAAELRVLIEISCQRQWRDMNTRLRDIQQCTTRVGVRASNVALFSGTDVSEAARSFANTASALTAAMAKNTKMGGIEGMREENDAGYVEPQPDFTRFDEEISLLQQAIASEIAGLDRKC